MKRLDYCLWLCHLARATGFPPRFTGFSPRKKSCEFEGSPVSSRGVSKPSVPERLAWPMTWVAHINSRICRGGHRKAIRRTGHAADRASIQKQIVLSYCQGRSRTRKIEEEALQKNYANETGRWGHTRHGKSRRRLHKRIRRMKPAEEGTECNDSYSKNRGHLGIWLGLCMQAIASRKLPTVNWLSVRSWGLYVQIQVKMA